MKTKIYAFTDEFGKIRYIGKTVQTLRLRLSAHFSSAKLDQKSHRANWIRSMFRKGFLPKIELIGEVDGDGCKEEIAWIKYFRDEGVNLVNATDGGDGTPGCIASEETRKKLSAAAKNMSLETREKLRRSHRGHQHSETTRQKMRMAQRERFLAPLAHQRLSESLRKYWGRKRNQGKRPEKVIPRDGAGWRGAE